MVLQIITKGVVEGIFLQIGLNEDFVHYFCYFLDLECSATTMCLFG